VKSTTKESKATATAQHSVNS